MPKNITPINPEDNSIITQKFNILMDYFKNFKKKFDNDENIKTPETLNEYGYADKLLFEILKTYLLVLLSITNNDAKLDEESESQSELKSEKVKMFTKIYYDIEKYKVDIDISRSQVKKNRSSYGVVKIGQFSREDFTIIDQMLLKFHKSFKNRYIKEELEKDRIPSETGYALPSKFPETYNEILGLKTNLQQIQKINASDEQSKPVVDKLGDEYAKIFGVDSEDSKKGYLNLDYIVNAINANKDFDDSSIPDTAKKDPSTTVANVKRFSKDYKLDFLNLLHDNDCLK
jgi:hypothetical protein